MPDLSYRSGRKRIITPCQKDNTHPHWDGKLLESLVLAHCAERARVTNIPEDLITKLRQVDIETVKEHLAGYYEESGIAKGGNSAEKLVQGLEVAGRSVFRSKGVHQGF